MRVQGIELANFRNYANLAVEFPTQITILVGPNASGKTNVVEAIYLASYGRVLRGKDADGLRWGSTEASVRVRYELDGGMRREVRVQLRAGEKLILLDGKRLDRRAELVGSFPVVVCWSEDLKVAQGEPQARRRFVDGLVTLMEPAYLDTLRDYNRTLRQRNRALGLLASGRADASTRRAVEAWSERLAELGALVVEKRRHYLGLLEPEFQRQYGELAGGKVECHLRYVTQLGGGGSVAEILLRALAARREQEVSRGTTLAGPHLDDVSIEVGGVDVRRFGSRGEAKSAVLALRLAEVALLRERRDERPVVVLDDAFSDLDDERAGRVLRSLGDLQGILTSAEESRTTEIGRKFAGDLSILRVREGQIEGRVAV